MRIAVLVAGATALLLAGVAAVGAVVWSDLDAREREVVGPILRDELGLVAMCGLLFVLLLSFAVAAVLARYAGAARRLAADTEVMAEGNPAHRAQPAGAAELRWTAEAVNRLAERHEAARAEMDRAVARGREEIEEERNLLAALLAQLAPAVLVCNLDGRILLYNEAARDQLGGEDGRVGIGRSVFRLLDREVVGHALGRIDRRDEERPRTRFLAAAAGLLLRVQMTPVRDREGATTGFVISAEDVTAVAEHGERRDALLRTLTEETRSAVGSLRAAVEAMVEYGDLDEGQRARFLEIVREETWRLSGRVDEVMAQASEGAERRWALDEMRGGDLLAALAGGIGGDGGPEVDVAEGGEDLWVGVEPHAFAQAMTDAVGVLRSEDRGVARVRLALLRDNRHARLEVRWEGRRLDVENLRAWEERFRDVLVGHGGEAWSRTEPGGGVLLCVLLPVAEPAERPPAPRREPGAGVASRPQLYDFALLGRSEPTELDDHPLDGLRCTVFDCETTGLDHERDALVSIAAVRVVNGRLLADEAFEQLIDPARPVPEAAVRVHGITDEMLAGQPSAAEVVPRFERFAEDTVLVGHDVAFDLRFIARLEGETGVRLDHPVLDTLLLDAVAHPDHEDHTLEAIAARLGISVVGRHTALGDALLTAEVLIRLLPALRARGVRTLGEARAAVAETREARTSAALYAPR